MTFHNSGVSKEFIDKWPIGSTVGVPAEKPHDMPEHLWDSARKYKALTIAGHEVSDVERLGFKEINGYILRPEWFVVGVDHQIEQMVKKFLADLDKELADTRDIYLRALEKKINREFNAKVKLT